jgi:hypothetical protein
VVAALFVVASFSWGLAFYGLGFYLAELEDRRGWSLTALSWVTFVFYLAGTALNFVVSRWLGAGRSRPVFLAGAVTLAAAVAAIGHANSLPMLVAIYLLMAFGWSCTSLAAISAVVLAWFGPRSGPPLTVALTGASVGGAVLVPVLNVLTEHVGFAGALAVVAAVELVVVGGLALTIIGRVVPAPAEVPLTEPDPGRSAGDSGVAAGSGAAWSVVREHRFWPLALGLAVGLLVQVGFLVHQLSILDSTLTKSTAAKIVAVTTISAMGGRLVFIAVVRRSGAAAPGALFLVLQAVSLVWLAASGRGTLAATTCSAAFGAGVGVLVVIAPLLTRATWPEREFTTVFPVVAVGYQLTIAAGAPFTAIAHDQLGGYGPTLFVLAVLDALAAGLIAMNWWMTRRPPVVVGRRAR